MMYSKPGIPAGLRSVFLVFKGIFRNFNFFQFSMGSKVGEFPGNFKLKNFPGPKNKKERESHVKIKKIFTVKFFKISLNVRTKKI